MSEWFSDFGQMFAATLRVSTPLLFATLGGLLCERAGVVNIALEGLMLFGAFVGAAVAYATHSPWLGLLAAVGVGIWISALYGFMVIPMRANQVVTGMALNMLAAGATPFLSKIFFGSSGATPSLPIESRFQSELIWIVWGLVFFFTYWIHCTPSGCWLRFAGEKPEALDSAGISVNQVRWISVILGGVLASLGGVSLSVYLASSFVREMTAGRGFMALAALIFGKWKPLPAAIACLLFGFTDAVQIRLQGVVLWGREPVPVQFIQILPYLATMMVLAGWVGQSRAPAALGLPFRKG